MRNVAAEFIIGQRPSINAEFSIEQNPAIETIFQIDSTLQVVGEGVINVTTQNGIAKVTSTNFTHEQGIASDTWIITHNLNKRPSVTVVDSSDSVIVPDEITYIDDSQLVLNFLSAFSGMAYLN